MPVVVAWQNPAGLRVCLVSDCFGQFWRYRDNPFFTAFAVDYQHVSQKVLAQV